MGLLKRLFGAPDRGTAPQLYAAIVATGRARHWYAQGEVPDTIDGRFDMIVAILAQVLMRLESLDGSQESVWLTELFVDDMDGQLRQSGVGDLGVGKRMGRLMSVLGGRIGALRELLAPDDGARDDGALVAALERNLTLTDGADKAWLALEVRRLHALIDSTRAEDLMAARIAR